MTIPIAQLLRWTLYLIQKVATPKTFANRIGRAFFWGYIDEHFLEWRTHYLSQYLAFQKEFSTLPRHIADGFTSDIELLNAPNKRGCDLILLKKDADSNHAFIERVNTILKNINIADLDYDTQTSLGDIWDHLSYGICLSTICVEMGRIAGPPGSITKARIAYKAKEVNNNGKASYSIGPFQIRDINWKAPLSHLENLPHPSPWIHLGHFFRLLLPFHKKAIAEMQKGGSSFADKDPSWVIALYARKDILSYLMLLRRFYTGSGSYSNIKIGDKVLDSDTLFIKNLAFAMNAIAIMKSRDRWYKTYPSDKVKDPDLSSHWKKMLGMTVGIY